MKKYYKKINDLVNEEVSYPNPNYISAWDIITVYLTKYRECFDDVNKLSRSDSIKKALNKDIDCEFKYINKNRVDAYLDNSTLTISFDTHKTDNIKVISYGSSNYEYTEGDIEMYKGIVANDLVKYYQKCYELNNVFDRSHDDLLSVNCPYYLLLVDKEALLFVGPADYIDMMLDDNKELDINCKGISAANREAVKDKLEILLKNVYFNIEDAPIFLRDDLYAIRNKELQENPYIKEDNNVMKRVRNVFKK